jgi:osmotically inducible protein OsmC
MPIAVRRASVRWSGGFATGEGRLLNGSSGALDGLTLTLPSRIERPNQRTSPEELLASAHAACFAMAVTSILEQDGHSAKAVDVTAVCTLDRVGDAFRITTIELSVDVADLDESTIATAVKQAEIACPISAALRESVKINVQLSNAAPGRE